MTGKKVPIIIITEGHNYSKSVKDGAPFTTVDYFNSTYGGGCPCGNDDGTIRREDDIAVAVTDERRLCLPMGSDQNSRPISSKS